MLIDEILDRKDGKPYFVRDFYSYIFDEYQIFKSKIFENILNALDSGTEDDVKKALCDYVIKCDYNPEICEYINSVTWLTQNYYNANDFDEILENIANEFNKFCKKQVKTTQDFNALNTIELKLKEINGGGNDE